MNRVVPVTNNTEYEDRSGHSYDISPDAYTEQHSATVTSDQIVDDNNSLDGDNSDRKGLTNQERTSSHGEDDVDKLLEDVKKGVQKHMIYRTRGVVKFEDLLGTLKDYKRDGYQPKPGTVIETIDASMEWNLAIVSNIYAAPEEEAVAFAGLLDNVAIHEIANDEKKNLILKMDSQEKYCCTAITQDTDRTGMLSHGNDPDEVRPAKAAVIATWGYAPLYWMQYQLLFAEQQMRFEKYHAFDFEEINWKHWINERFEKYIKDKKNNKAFCEYYHEQEKENPGSCDALKRLIFEPFETMDSIINKWFDGFDGAVSCYMYFSFLGRDVFFVLASFLIQVIIPMSLFMVSLRQHKTNIQELCAEKGEAFTNNGYILGGQCGSHSEMNPRFDEDRLACRLAFIGIVLYYMVKVLPDEMNNFVTVASESQDTISRLNSLRKAVYNMDEDDIFQKLGYRLSVFMNSTYNTGLYIINILVLFTYSDPWDIVLNALAVEFIKDVDESFTLSAAYDEEYRWLKAGALEMVIQRFLDVTDLDVVLKKPDNLDNSKTPNSQNSNSTHSSNLNSGGIAGGGGGADQQPSQATSKSSGGGGGANQQPSQATSQSSNSTNSKTSNSTDSKSNNSTNSNAPNTPTKRASFGRTKSRVQSIVKFISGIKEGNEGSKEDIVIDKEEVEQQAKKLTQKPKIYFYDLYTFLKNAESDGKEDRNKRTVIYWIARSANYFLFLFGYTAVRPIFDRFGEYRKKDWKAIAFCRAADQNTRPDLTWLTLESVKNRLKRVRKVTKNEKNDSRVDAEETLMKEANANDDRVDAEETLESWQHVREYYEGTEENRKRELQIIDHLQKMVRYDVRIVSAFWEDMRYKLTLLECIKPLKRAFERKDYHRVFIVICFSIIDWVSTLLEMLFLPAMILVCGYCVYFKF